MFGAVLAEASSSPPSPHAAVMAASERIPHRPNCAMHVIPEPTPGYRRHTQFNFRAAAAEASSGRACAVSQLATGQTVRVCRHEIEPCVQFARRT